MKGDTMAATDKAEKISITLPPDMLNSIKEQVRVGAYGSTSEVIREAMRLWQREQEEHSARLDLIRQRIDRSIQEADGGELTPIDKAFDNVISTLHQRDK